MLNRRCYLNCCNCHSAQYDGGFEDARELRASAKLDGWIYLKVENGSYWDFCPKCASKYNWNKKKGK